MEVRVSSGALRGEVVDGVAVFRGIPFAAPPFGEARFRPPQPAPRWHGVRDATAHGPGCPQPVDPRDPMHRYFNPDTQGEDCLSLHVWTPDVCGSGLPVMVWIHGGGYLTGAGSALAHDGSTFARSGVVHVSVNYRLNVEGFLYFQGEPANLGLLDQVAALCWVQDNIAAFGGDPANVTVFGQSAGAVSVQTLLAMPAARGLFRRAIAQSGCPVAAVIPADALEVTRRLAAILGVPPTRDGFAGLSPAQTLPALTPLVLDFNNPVRWGARSFMVSPFRPVIDGDTMPEAVLPSVAAGGSSEVDLLTGTNRDETTDFLRALGMLDHVDERWAAMAVTAFGVTDSALDVYQATSRPGAGFGELVQAAWTDWAFRIPTLRLLEAHRGRRFCYQFDWASPALPDGFGATHALEIPFVRDALGVFAAVAPEARRILGEDPPRELATAMHRAWVSFATHGNPGWPEYDTTRRATMRFDTVSEPVDDLARAERELWDGLR